MFYYLVLFGTLWIAIASAISRRETGVFFFFKQKHQNCFQAIVTNYGQDNQGEQPSHVIPHRDLGAY